MPFLQAPVIYPTTFGRQPQLAHLSHLVDLLADGRGGTVLVTGEAGIGKTRLVGEAQSLALRNSPGRWHKARWRRACGLCAATPCAHCDRSTRQSTRLLRQSRQVAHAVSGRSCGGRMGRTHATMPGASDRRRSKQAFGGLTVGQERDQGVLRDRPARYAGGFGRLEWTRICSLNGILCGSQTSRGKIFDLGRILDETL
jgi:hypothetical protein